MADIFDEIDEELKRDRTQELWTKYGKYVMAAAAAVSMPLIRPCAMSERRKCT